DKNVAREILAVGAELLECGIVLEPQAILHPHVGDAIGCEIELERARLNLVRLLEVLDGTFRFRRESSVRGDWRLLRPLLGAPFIELLLQRAHRRTGAPQPEGGRVAPADRAARCLSMT